MLFLPAHPAQEGASGLPAKDPHQPVSSPAGLEHDVLAQLLALVLLRLRPVHLHGGRAPLLPPGLLHLDGPGSPPHVPNAGQDLQLLCSLLHAQTLRRRMG